MYRVKFENELKNLKLSLLKMCAEVSGQIKNSVKSLISGDLELAVAVASRDDVIDAAEQDIERQCHKILLTENPVARDFREVFAILKLITDLERIGDQAEDIANLVISLRGENVVKKFRYIPMMADVTLEMVNGSVEAFIKQDLSLAESVVRADDQLDGLFIKVKQDLVEKIKGSPDAADEIIAVIMVAKYLERIGDHAVNICEWTKYFETGCK